MLLDRGDYFIEVEKGEIFFHKSVFLNYWMEYPPSMAIVCPVINLESGPTRKETTPVTSDIFGISPNT